MGKRAPLNENDFTVIDGGKYKIYRKTGFNAVNHNANLKYVLVGITPGTNQTSKTAQKEAAKEHILLDTIEYKMKFAFRGKSMRNNIQRMFKHINESKHRGILTELIKTYGDDINNLFKYTDDSIIDFTSLIKDATFVNTKDGWKMFKSPQDICEENKDLFSKYRNGFYRDYQKYYQGKNIVFIACGKYVFRFLKTVFGNNETLIAIVHPSPKARDHIDSFLNDSNDSYDPEEEKS